MKTHENPPPPLGAHEFVAWDTEFFCQRRDWLHRPHGDFACATFCVGGQDVYLVDSLPDLVASLRNIKKADWILQFGEYDITQVRGLGISVPPRRYWDTGHVEQELFSGYYSRFGLADLSRRWLKRPMNKEVREDFIAAGDSPRLTKSMRRYAAGDAWTTYAIAMKQQALTRIPFSPDEDIDCTEYLERTWYGVDMPALWAMLDMRGVMVNQEAWRSIAEAQQAIVDTTRSRLDYNPGSTLQVQKRLIAGGAKLRRKTRGGDNYSVDDEVLKALADDGSAEAREVLDYRSAKIFASTFGLKFLDRVEADGRIHPDWRVIGTETFRTSCGDPNLQQIPKRNAEWGPRYRRAITASPGCVFIKADYVQCQIAVVAQVTDDDPFKRIFSEGGDVHTANAVWMFGVPEAKVTKTQRDSAKAVTFGSLFNETAAALAATQKIPVKEAREFLDKFRAAHPGYAAWCERALASRDDYVYGPGGHRLWFNSHTGKHGLNNRINSPIQEGEATIHKRALALLHRRWPKEWGQYGVVLAVHDEIVVEVEKKFARACRKLVEGCTLEAERVVLPDVTPAADVEICVNWWGDSR